MSVASEAVAHAKLLEKPDRSFVQDNVDKYFSRTRKVLEFLKRDPVVIYKTFLRVDSIAIYKFTEEFLDAAIDKDKYTLTKHFEEGEFVPEKTPLFSLTGKFSDLVELETGKLGTVGWPCLSALNAQTIREAAGPDITILDMAARHCPGITSGEVQKMSAYAAHIGGFNGTSTDVGAFTFGKEGLGTMPHALIGMFTREEGMPTVEAAKAFSAALPDVPLTVLVDYEGKEVTDSIECFKALGSKLKAVRLDTHGGRFCEGVTRVGEDGISSLKAITRLYQEFGVSFAGQYKSYAYGKGVTAEAVHVLRKALDEAGATDVKIVVSSGFTPEKVQAFMKLKAPIDMIGTGSYLPIDIRDTYATSDIVSYGGNKRIKVGREWLLED